MKHVEALKMQVKKYVDAADEHTLKMMHTILEAQQEDWYDELESDQKKSLQKSISQADRGEVIPHDKVKKMFAKNGV